MELKTCRFEPLIVLLSGKSRVDEQVKLGTRFIACDDVFVVLNDVFVLRSVWLRGSLKIILQSELSSRREFR